jgi:hypothetical protein
MHGISTIIEIVMIVFILVSLSVLLWFFSSGAIKTLTDSGSNRMQNAQQSMSGCMVIDSIYKNKIYIKNCGNGNISNSTLGVFLNDAKVNSSMTPQNIGRGEIGTITYDLGHIVPLGDAQLKIDTASAKVVQKISTKYSCSSDRDCVMEFDFREGAGNITYDSSSYHNDGLLYSNSGPCPAALTSSCPQWVSDEYVSALFFDGTGNNWIQVADSSSLDLAENFTLEALIRPDAYSGGIIVNKENTYEFALWGNATIEWAFNNVNPGWSWHDTGVQIPLNKWTRIDISYSNGNISAYKDGTLYDTYQGSGPLWTSDNTLQIGEREDGTQAFSGGIGPVRIYNRTLSAEEIAGQNFANILSIENQ